MQNSPTIYNYDYHRYLRDLRMKKIDDADFALANNDMHGAASLFEAAATLSRELGDRQIERDLSAYAIIAKVRVGIAQDEESTITPEMRVAFSWRTYLKSLQKGASEAFSRKNFREARYHVLHMIAIAEKIGMEELAANYLQNLERIDEAIKKTHPHVT
ncbi:MAG: hypothetical protein GYA24_16120 [Candidatus Lokiarchaeota archaeon]|nr:hypothetical protein [Candidatus Lokiarchaeota archaeon]